jgi:hypothetical protein
MLGDYVSRLARSEHDRVARYREQVERFREIAKMETQPRVRARLLELAEEYERLIDDMAGTRPQRPGGGQG